MQFRLAGVLLLLVAGLTLTAAMLVQTDEKGEFLEKRAEVVIRDIGHVLLLHGGDSTSRVLPVKSLTDDIFQIGFENKFSFIPDSLVKIVRRSLASANLPLSYLVQVFDCSNREVVYAFEVRSPSYVVEPCLGRVQPTGCYLVQIEFAEPIRAGDPRTAYYFGIGLLGIMLIGFVLWKPSPKFVVGQSPFVPKATFIGRLEFDEKNGILKLRDKQIQLSNKESKVLKILASNVNQLVDRNHLENEIWRSEGVITGRSLDMFVSKLRKKLCDDPSIRIVNVHGRGYRLEFSGQRVI